MSKKSKSFKNISEINYEDPVPETTINADKDEHVIPSYSYVFAAIALLFMIYILNWLNNIDKCLCSNLPEGKYLKEWFSFYIVVIIAWYFILILFGINNSVVRFFAIPISILGLINLVFIIRTIMYIHKLKKNKCKCGSAFQQSAIYAVLLFEVSIIALFLTIILFGFIASFFVN
jgi:hypothetical protein